MKTIEIELTTALGGHLVEVEYTSEWGREDWGCDDTHHDYRWVLQSVHVERLSRYPETDAEGNDMIPFTANDDQLVFIERELFDHVKNYGE